MKTPTVSVIIPAYNQAQFVSEAIDSVLAQSFKDFEIVVVNDGSTDNTEDVLKKYSGKITYIYQENKGPAAAKNKGIVASRGKYVATLDSDDIWLSQKLEMQTKHLDSNGKVGLVYTDAYMVDSDGTRTHNVTSFAQYAPFSGYVLDKLILNNFIPSLTVMVRRTVLDTVGLFDESLLIGEDWDLWLRIASQFPIDFVDAPLGERRIHGGNITRESEVRMLLHNIRIMHKMVNSDNFPDNLRKFVHKKLSILHYFLGKEYMASREMQGAKGQFKAAVRYDCFSLLAVKALVYYLVVTLREWHE